MNFFCSSAEFDEYVADMELDRNLVVKCDMDAAIREAYNIFSVDEGCFDTAKPTA